MQTLFNTIRSYVTTSTYVFEPADAKYTWRVTNLDGEVIATDVVFNSENRMDPSDIQIQKALGLFLACSPEAAVYRLMFDPNDVPKTSEMPEFYAKLIMGCALIRARKLAAVNNKKWSDTISVAVNRAIQCVEWLMGTDFFTCPGSTVYHDSQPQGLLNHTIKVAQEIVKLYQSNIFPHSVNIEDAILVALVHDWCKINLYLPYSKNVKNDNTGVWEQVTAYKIADDKFCPFGHGAASLYLAAQLFKLRPEEALAIRWHMGEYNVANNEMNDLHYANEHYPLVFMLQFADRLATAAYI